MIAVSALLTGLGARLAGLDRGLDSQLHSTERARRSWPARRGVAMARKASPMAVGGLVWWQLGGVALALTAAGAAYLVTVAVSAVDTVALVAAAIFGGVLR